MPGQKLAGFPGTSAGRPRVLQRNPTTTTTTTTFFLLLGNSITRGHTQLAFPFTDRGERLARSISERSGNRIEKWVSRHAGTILSGGGNSRRTEEDTHEPLNAVAVRPRKNLALQTSVFSAVKANLRREKRYWVLSPARGNAGVFHQKDR